MSYFSQDKFSLRLEWGLQAVELMGPDVECIIVVDVMSFSTCVSIAVDRGGVIFPYPSRDSTAELYAAEVGAVCASSKRRPAEGYSLSPSSLMSIQAGFKLVLPSPNGSAAAYSAIRAANSVYCGSFRNLRATAAACHAFSTVLVVPCGERWPDGSLRPCVEDYLAAGGIVSALEELDSKRLSQGPVLHGAVAPSQPPVAALQKTSISPEARVAAAAYLAFASVRTCVVNDFASSAELTQRGFAGDVPLCFEENVSQLACKLEQGRFVPVVIGGV